MIIPSVRIGPDRGPDIFWSDLAVPDDQNCIRKFESVLRPRIRLLSYHDDPIWRKLENEKADFISKLLPRLQFL